MYETPIFTGNMLNSFSKYRVIPCQKVTQINKEPCTAASGQGQVQKHPNS